MVSIGLGQVDKIVILSLLEPSSKHSYLFSLHFEEDFDQLVVADPSLVLGKLSSRTRDEYHPTLQQKGFEPSRVVNPDFVRSIYYREVDPLGLGISGPLEPHVQPPSG